MRYLTIILAVQILLITCCFAQTPKIKGTVKVSIQKGTIEGDLEVSNIPTIGKYSIWLNAGLNIRYFRDSTDLYNYDFDKYYKSDKSGEAFQYVLSKNDSIVLPHRFKINYIGAYPVLSDTFRMSPRNDWKGNMAFNGKTLRASDQTAWYPVLYDTLNDVIYDKVTYDLQVICKDCQSIYINGSIPKASDSATFKSDKPCGLMLFAGNYDFNKIGKTYFVNSELQPAEQTVLSGWTSRTINFYEKNLKLPYGSDITYLGATPVSKRNNWAFVTYPTITVIGRQWALKEFFDKKTHQIKDSSDITYFAHELGHYYFGTSFVPNAELRWFFLEGITDYISIVATREILGETAYKKIISDYIGETKDYKVIPLSEITQSEQIDNTYKYRYTPLLLTALEKQIGKQRVWKWLTTILESKNAPMTNYSFFKSTLIASGVTEGAFLAFENTYIKAADAKQKVFDAVK